MLEGLLPGQLDCVLTHLELSDLCSLRLVSRHLERESTQAFSAAAFSQLRVDLSRESLRRVRTIAGHDRFRLAVRSLWCGYWAGKITGTRPRRQAPYGVNGYWPRLEDGRVNCGCELARSFVDSVARFDNCTSVTVTDERAAIHHGAFMEPENGLSSADAVDLVFHALSAPGAPSLRCFQIRVSRALDWHVPGYITRDAVTLVGKNLTYLEELNLEIDAGDGESTANLLHLITAAPGVRTLRLWIHENELYHGGPRIENLLTDYINSVLHVAPALDTLFIWSKAISAASLRRLLSSSLMRLDLKIGLRHGTWVDILEHLQAAPFPELRRFSMFACSDGLAQDFIAFCPLWKDREVMSESLGVSLRFRSSQTARRAFHVTGVMVEAAGDDAASRMKAAMGAMVEYSHRCPQWHDASSPCAERSEMKMGTDGGDGDAREVNLLWSGLPRALDEIE